MIPKSVTSVGQYALGYLPNLKDLTILNPNAELDDDGLVTLLDMIRLLRMLGTVT